jgi:cell wall-associated NlpC family hydrolase
MTGTSRLRVSSVIAAALSSAVLLATGPVALAQPSEPRASAGGCSSALNGYKPHLAATYLSDPDTLYILYVTKIKEKSGGAFSGEFDINGSLSGAAGTFTGTIRSGDVTMNATFAPGNGLGISKLTFTGKAGCFLTTMTTDSLTTVPAGLLSKKWTVVSACPDPESLYPTPAAIACTAEHIRDDFSAGIPDQGAIPYVSGGGHGLNPGPTTKKVNGKKVLGLDCSGFTRWVYYIAYGTDVLYSKNQGTTVDQWKLTKRVSKGKVGEFVFFTKPNGTVTHVGINLGDGFMLDEPHTGSFLRAESISKFAKSDHEKVVYRRLGLDE